MSHILAQEDFSSAPSGLEDSAWERGWSGFLTVVGVVVSFRSINNNLFMVFVRKGLANT